MKSVSPPPLFLYPSSVILSLYPNRTSHSPLARSHCWQLLRFVPVGQCVRFCCCSDTHTLKTVMTVVLVAFRALVEGSKKNTLAPLVCQSGVRADRRKGRRAGGPPGSLSFYSNIDLDTDLFYWRWSPSPSLSFTLVFPVCLSPPFLLPSLPLPVSFISFCPPFSLSLSFSHPSEVVA